MGTTRLRTKREIRLSGIVLTYLYLCLGLVFSSLSSRFLFIVRLVFSVLTLMSSSLISLLLWSSTNTLELVLLVVTALDSTAKLSTFGKPSLLGLDLIVTPGYDYSLLLSSLSS